jgi:uncharacterized protein (DUF1778 family)
MPTAAFSKARSKSSDRTARKGDFMQIRMAPRLKALIVEAAALSGTTMSDFVSRASQRAAEEEILNRRVFTLDDKLFDKFVAVVESQPPLSKEVRARLRRKPVWERA